MRLGIRSHVARRPDRMFGTLPVWKRPDPLLPKSLSSCHFLDARFWRAHLLTLTYIYFQLRSRSTRLRASVSPIISTLNWASSSCNNDCETTLLRLVMRSQLSCPPSQLEAMSTAPSRSRRRTRRHGRRSALAALALATAALVPTTSAVFITVPAGTAGQVIPTGGWTSGTFSASGKVSPYLVLLSVLSNPPASCDRSGRSGHRYCCIVCRGAVLCRPNNCWLLRQEAALACCWLRQAVRSASRSNSTRLLASSSHLSHGISLAN